MDILDSAYLLILFFTAIAGIVRFKRHSPAFKLLTILVSVSFSVEIAGKIIAVKWHNNMPLYHVYTPLEYLFLTAIYGKLLTGLSRKIITIAVLPVVIFAIINGCFIQSLNEFPSNVFLVCETAYLFYSLLGFREMLLHPNQTALYKQSPFWLNVAMLFFSTTLFIYFGLLNYAINHHLKMSPLIVFVSIINLIYAALLSIAILKDKNDFEALKNEKYR